VTTRRTPAKRRPQGVRTLRARDVSSLRRQLAQRARPATPRFRADPDDVQRSVARLVLTLVDFIRKLMERQAVRRMEEGTLSPVEIERMGRALMQLEKGSREDRRTLRPRTHRPQPRPGSPRPPDLTPSVCVVTGASDGIGKEIARGLAEQGAHVVLACRDASRAAAARDDIARTTGSRTLEVRLVDFAVPASIHTFADELLRAHPRVGVLVNNAGMWSRTRRITASGIELTWATNMLGYFLTTRLLLDRLRESAPARIVNVASNLAHGLDLDDVGFTRRTYDGVAAYAQSKQANRMWTWALARRLHGTGVTANAVHPGGVSTGIFRKGGGVAGWVAHVATAVTGRSPKRGADTALWLATSPDVDGRTGLYFSDRTERRCHFRDESQEERLWSLCEDMTR
jgi:NAD(P)-dependent dehydrogenase (short-subunit alcohol dehydrogenase family)